MAVAAARRELVVPAGARAEAAVEPQVEELQAAVLAQLEAAYEEAKARPMPQIAAPTRWWDVLAIGPFSAPFDLGFPKPNPIVQVGQPITIFAVLFLNPTLPGVVPPTPNPIPGSLLPYRIMYDTTNVTTATHDAALSGTINGNLAPVLFIVRPITLTPNQAGLYELNLRAQILTAMSTTMVPFAGYASRIDQIDASIFGPNGLVVRFEQPVRFDAYV
ncbi:MAG: hypothetical protein HXY39_06395 [Chloroflexi bacterium]|nr:hypothetical protein [Chloroflexota bacterium]